MIGEFHVSTLRCEPYHFVGDESVHWPSYTYWRIFVDNELVSDFAQPFISTDPTLELFGFLEMPVWGHGGGYVSVRQCGQYVIWCPLIEDTVDYFVIGPYLSYGRFIVFQLDDYIKTLAAIPLPAPTFGLKTGSRSLKSTHDLEYRLSSNPETSLPRLSKLDLQYLLFRALPENDLPLYLVPEKTDDRRGVKLLIRLKQVLEHSVQDLTASDPPEEAIELRIGLDLQEFVECIWQVGKVAQGYAIFFVSTPHFPVWLTCRALSDVLASECSAFFPES